MEADLSFSTLLVTFMVDVAILAGVPLAIATLSGLVVSFFQAITQIQDQTLAQTVKIVSVILVLLFFGVRLAAPLMNSTAMIFDEFARVAQ